MWLGEYLDVEATSEGRARPESKLEPVGEAGDFGVPLLATTQRQQETLWGTKMTLISPQFDYNYRLILNY